MVYVYLCVCVLYIYIYNLFYTNSTHQRLISLYIGHFCNQQLTTYPLVPYIRHTVKPDSSFFYI